MTDSRRIIEALRCGVPNGKAVAALGCHQPDLLRHFESKLSTPRQQPSGLIVKGGFGAGKSHTLEHLSWHALQKNFICSKITINKETALHDPSKLFRAAAEFAVVPGRFGSGIREAARRINRTCQSYRELRTWMRDPAVDGRFGLSLQLYEAAQNDPEIQDRILQFWTGEPLGVAAIREFQHRLHVIPSRDLSVVRQRDLGLQRFQFIARLIQSAGFAGWVLLIDEVELIGCYSLLQRAKSYGELARFSGVGHGFACPGLITVFAVTDDFDAAILEGKGDLRVVPALLKDRDRPGEEHLKHLAPAGMKEIRNNGVPIVPPQAPELRKTYQIVKRLYSDAYSCTPLEVAGPERRGTNRIRHFVKRWITQWDMNRLYPEEVVELQEIDVLTDYSEDTATADLGESVDDALMEELLGRIIKE